MKAIMQVLQIILFREIILAMQFTGTQVGGAICAKTGKVMFSL